MRQTSFLALGAATVPAAIGPLTRIDLGRGSWIDHAPAWLPGADEWLDRLRSDLPWRSMQRPMYDRIVDVPRLINSFERTDVDIPPDLDALSQLFDTHYHRPFDRVGCNLYRNGADSVAWHADRVPLPEDSIVAIISVGERRPFCIRPLGGGSSRKWLLGDGDLFVLGGTIQACWQHAVPKVANAGERISVMVRG